MLQFWLDDVKKTPGGAASNFKSLEPRSPDPEVGIYKRKQESKKTRTRPRKKEKTIFFS